VSFAHVYSIHRLRNYQKQKRDYLIKHTSIFRPSDIIHISILILHATQCNCTAHSLSKNNRYTASRNTNINNSTDTYLLSIWQFTRSDDSIELDGSIYHKIQNRTHLLPQHSPQYSLPGVIPQCFQQSFHSKTWNCIHAGSGSARQKDQERIVEGIMTRTQCSDS
jgi:hypothetical protein